MLFSNDNGFSKNIKELQDEFKNHLTSFRKQDIYNDLVIINNKNINSYINTEFKLFTDLKEYIANNFFKILEKKYEDACVISMDSNSYNVDTFEIIEDDTDIHQYDNNEFEVEFFIYIFGFIVLKNILIDLEVFLMMKALKLLFKVKVIYFEKKMMNGVMS